MDSVELLSPKTVQSKDNSSEGLQFESMATPDMLHVREDESVEGNKVLVDSFHGPATDYGKVEPGLVPWQMLRSATWLLIMLWCSGPLLSFHCVGGPLEYGLAPLESEDAQEANTDQLMKWNPAQMAMSAVAGSSQPGYLPHLSGGEEIQAEWPRRNSFTPKSMSCDPSGRQLVVADDFGLYKADIEFGAGPPRSIFSRAPPCTIFEGQLLKDIGVVCVGGTTECRILVLHDNGRKVSECPLHKHNNSVSEASGYPPVQDLYKVGDTAMEKTPSHVETVSMRSTTAPVLRGNGRNLMSRSQNQIHKAVKVQVTPVVTWNIAGEWLKAGKDHIQSMAINKWSKRCLVQDATQSKDSGQAFIPKGTGCIIVGTEAGYVIGLRRHVTESRELVPEINMQHRPHSVVQGSLRMLHNGIVVSLRQGRETLEALDMKSGRRLGEWRLPKGISWITLCGAGGHLFVLGRDVSHQERRIVLWRFPLPSVLQIKDTPAPRDRFGPAQEI